MIRDARDQAVRERDALKNELQIARNQCDAWMAEANTQSRARAEALREVEALKAEIMRLRGMGGLDE